MVEHRLMLLRSITIPSLLGQSDPNFVWVLFIDREIPSSARRVLMESLEPFHDRVMILEGVAYARDAVNNILNQYASGGFYISSRLDDDDALHPTTIARIRGSARDFIVGSDHSKSMALTYPKGLEWVMYDMVDVWKRAARKDLIERSFVREYIRPFLGTSCIMISPVALGHSFFDISHATAGLDSDVSNCDIVQADTQDYMWLYCRHKQADSGIVKAKDGARVPMDTHALCQYFNLDEQGVLDYIAKAGEYAYVTDKKSMT